MALQESGIEVAGLQSMPELSEQDEFFWQAWTELSSGRSAGFSPNPISMESILAWCRFHRILDSQIRRTLLVVIRELDAVVMKHYGDSCSRNR